MHLLLEPPHTTAPALNMLHQATRRVELVAVAVKHVRVAVDPVRVRRAPQMLVQQVQPPELFVAQHALVRASVPLILDIIVR